MAFRLTAHRGRRLLGVAVTGLLLSSGGALWLEQRAPASTVAAADNPVPVTSPPPSTPQTAPPTTKPGPVRPAPDDYTPEEIKEIGTIEIPRIGLRHRVFHGRTLHNIDLGPSHWPGSAMPGETGNAVFAGHRVTRTHPFRHIDKLVDGDEVIFDIAGARTVYVVTDSYVITPRQLGILDPTPTPTATLFACHPPGSARQRYVVRLALRG